MQADVPVEQRVLDNPPDQVPARLVDGTYLTALVCNGDGYHFFA